MSGASTNSMWRLILRGSKSGVGKSTGGREKRNYTIIVQRDGRKTGDEKSLARV